MSNLIVLPARKTWTPPEPPNPAPPAGCRIIPVPVIVRLGNAA